MTDSKPGSVVAPMDHEAVEFQTALAMELASGVADLPGFPAGTLRVQCLLSEERPDIDEIARAAGLEPALGALLLRMANSAIYNTTARPVQDLRSAIQRVGVHMVRAAILSLALQQLRNADEMRPVRERLHALWRRGVVVGAIARVLAARVRVATADAAMLAGLLHVVGRLFVLTRLARSPRLLDRPGLPEKLLEDWGGRAGATLLRGWAVPEDLCRAVTTHDEPGRAAAAEPVLTDVLAAAVVLADLMPPSRSDYLDQIQLAQVFFHTEALWHRLGLGREQCSDALHIALGDMQQLRAQFGT